MLGVELKVVILRDNSIHFNPEHSCTEARSYLSIFVELVTISGGISSPNMQMNAPYCITTCIWHDWAV
jgi:hypothetical protein